MEDIIALPTEQPPSLPSTPWPDEPPARFAYPFQFHGDAREYFRIWIVNLALTILTLGIFSAWAKVRSERYFYGNTRLDNVPFEYLAQPWPILKGRLIAVVLFGAYVLAGQFSLGLQLGAAGVIALLTPWLIVRGAAFRARYSSWRGLSFRFVPDYAEAYIRYLLLLLPLAFTLGLLFPYVKAKQKQFFVEHHRYGGLWFRFRATSQNFYPPYVIAWVAMAGVMLVAGLCMGAAVAFSGDLSDSGSVAWLTMLFPLLIYAGYFVVWAFLAAALANLVYNHTDLGPHRFHSTLKGSRLLWIYVGNTLAILASAGLLIPWAKVRLARYRAQCLAVVTPGDLADFRAESKGDVDATASEMDGLFDIDIGL
jgi:uncharacterized membrane protein YjgN (DUF898 family)